MFLDFNFFLGFTSSGLLHWGSPDSRDLSTLCHPLGGSSHMSFQRGLYFPNQWWKVLPVTIIPHCSFSILQLSSLFVNSIIISFFLQCVIHRKRTLACSAEFLFLCALHRAWHVVCVCVCVKSFQSLLTLCDSMDRSLPGSSVPGILQARVLEWVAIFSRGSSQPGNWTRISRISGRRFTVWATREALFLMSPILAGGLFTTSIPWEGLAQGRDLENIL